MSETVHDSIQRLIYTKVVIEGLNVDETTDEIMDYFEAAFESVEDQMLIISLLAMIRPLVAYRAKMTYRGRTRSLEDRVFSGKPISVRSIDRETGDIIKSEELINWHDAQKQLLLRGFPLPSGRWVTYEESTPEDHEERARWQRGRAESVAKDAERHENLARLMREHGVERLGDLDVDLWKDIVTE